MLFVCLLAGQLKSKSMNLGLVEVVHLLFNFYLVRQLCTRKATYGEVSTVLYNQNVSDFRDNFCNIVMVVHHS